MKDCLRVSSIAGNLDTGFYFTVSANYSQNFIEKGTCLIVGLGVWDEETQSLKREPDGTYTKAKDIDGNEISEITIHMEITTKEAEVLAIASSEEPYSNIDLIPAKQEINVDVIGTVKLDAYIRYTNKDGEKVTVSGKAGKLTDELTYSMVAFFVPDGTEIIDYDKTYGIDLGGMWYPIGQAPITLWQRSAAVLLLLYPRVLQKSPLPRRTAAERVLPALLLLLATPWFPQFVSLPIQEQ